MRRLETYQFRSRITASLTGLLMLFTSRLSAANLLQWCRNLHHGYDIGLSPVKMFRQLAKSGPSAGRAIAERIATELQAGHSLADAVSREQRYFPPIFRVMVAVGEESGRLTQTLHELEDYFTTVISAQKAFRQALIYPAFVYVSAIVVIALMLFILGMLAPADGKAFDPLGLGLTGPTGAMLFLAGAAMFTSFVVVAFLFIKNNDALRPTLEGIGLKLPGISGCLRAFALQRFSMALSMTAEAGLRPHRSLAFAFEATANATYQKDAAAAEAKVRAGTPIPKALVTCSPGLFPSDFLDAAAVGEMTGKMPEVLAKQAEYYREEGTRKLKFVTMLAGGAVYACVGLMVIVVIIRMVMSIGGVYQDAMKGL